ncbi:MAG: SDR family NAD(P)-dependent oxidoreductase [Bdellovibrionota bacterium]|nr:SDR family NAD(P)-dependent oxidoreductase [Bdellovibrionota bacterium]
MKRTALITGATSGFGLATAGILAKEYRLVITGRRKDRLQKIKEDLSHHTDVLDLCFDISDLEETKKQIKAIPIDFSEISILVNNAGLALGLEPADKVDFQDWQTMINTNVTGLAHLTHLLLPTLKQQPLSDIINIGSIAGSWPYPGGNVYGATKAFVAQFSRNLRADLLGSSVRVCNIEPGLADTEFSKVRFKGNETKAKEVYNKLTPLYAEDIAKQVKWVIDQDAHINLNSIEIMPSCQAWGPLQVKRGQ